MEQQYTIADFLEMKSVGSLSWSHDGSRVAFLSNETGVFQLYVANRDGGGVEQFTSFEDGVDHISFSPVRDELLIGRSKGGNENTQLSLFDVSTRDIRLLTDAPTVQHRFGGWSRDGKYIAYASNSKNGTDFDVFVTEVKTGVSRCVFDQGGNCRSVGFSPRGNMLLVRRSLTTESDDLFVVDLQSGAEVQITNDVAKPCIGAICWLPDESGFFLTTDKERDFSGFAFYHLSQKEEKYVLTAGWDISGATITRDGKSILLLVNEDGYNKVTVYDTESMKPLAKQNFPKGNILSCSWSPDGKFLAFSLSSARKNSSMYVWSKEEDRYWPVAHMSQGVPEEHMVEPELVHYVTFDNRAIPAYVYSPKRETNSVKRKSSAVVYIHGGPAAQFRPTFNPLIQYLVYGGYTVIAPNVRGSVGYGKVYAALDDVLKRKDSFRDIACLHAYLKTRDDVDINKVFLWGGSYGGYMVLAGLTFYPELWAGGVDIVGISNLVTFLENTSSYRRSLREAEYGSLSADREFMESISPSNFVNQIQAPLFIIHGVNDPRVPVSEAKQMYEKLLANGRKAELVIYPDEGHGLAKLKNRIDAYSKALSFLNSTSEEKLISLPKSNETC